MTITEQILIGGLIINTVGMFIVLFKLVWGSASSHVREFASLDRACGESVNALRSELLLKIDTAHSNAGQGIVALGSRIHDIELKAMETRAVMAEKLQLYMLRDSYYRATEEFKRDNKETISELRKDMDSGFGRVEMLIENVRRANAQVA